MNLWGHCFSQYANLKLQGFLSHQTNKDRSQKNSLHSPKNRQKKCYDPCLYGRAEILVNFGLHFGRNDVLINSFWIQLTLMKDFFLRFDQNQKKSSHIQTSSNQIGCHGQKNEIRTWGWRLRWRGCRGSHGCHFLLNLLHNFILASVYCFRPRGF